MQDDGKETATVTVPGLSGYAASALRAGLRIVPVDAKGRVQPQVTISPTGVAYDPALQSLTLTFPSLAKLGISKVAATGNGLDLSLAACDRSRRLCPDLDDGNAVVSFVAHVATAASTGAKPASFTLSAAARAIVIDGDTGRGQLTLRIAKLPAGETALLALPSGADTLASSDAGGAALARTADGYSIAQNGTFTFAFANLLDRDAVTFTAQEVKGGAKLGTTSLTLPVRRR